MKTYQPKKEGKVYLVGAGPGDPGLITVKGADTLRQADVIVYDRLANPELLDYTPEDSEHIYVGKKPGKPSVSQEQINTILVAKAQDGKTVVRLKGGDPFVFGRGGEECEALKAQQVAYEVIPGISSALSAPLFAGIPVTHRKVARSFTVVTGHTITGTNAFDNWGHLAHADTLVVLMGVKNLAKITDLLIGLGKDRSTPVAVIGKATYKDQQTVLGTLENIAEKASHSTPPATIVIGELAAKADELAWFKEKQTQLLGSQAKESASKLAHFAG
ncbi:uroporphyrinogen-III C-methyltransferase [Gracilimonas mengyeensis]|uniref:uroporphyrinogen-III C-methyltransferase n=1 Tax=Gracilimonas mengyeensis TaxID=1302730 RepID=A0A521F6B8_9BACT|nr:uroporphyrinogen-III C-methyltransferase [Gracilimonas mengyeensis]SMO91636.1 uroporphyrin-III C-methyltransferase [Gracilimonas mengyeensis]